MVNWRTNVTYFLTYCTWCWLFWNVHIHNPVWRARVFLCVCLYFFLFIGNRFFFFFPSHGYLSAQLSAAAGFFSFLFLLRMFFFLFNYLCLFFIPVFKLVSFSLSVCACLNLISIFPRHPVHIELFILKNLNLKKNGERERERLMNILRMKKCW